MIPIKFRGIDAFGRYHYGDVWQRNDGTVLFDRKTHVWIRVSPNSIAQLVGYDCDGNEVYEGDVLVLEHGGNIFEYTAHLNAFATADNGCYIVGFSNLKLKEVKS